MSAGREQWNSKAGFVLAAIGAAVGLGNIWRFSYVAGENGGGAFLVVYVICAVAIGAPIVVAELAVGRAGRGDAVAAFQAFASPRSIWRYMGWIGVAGSTLILSYYSVIAGWALKYFVGGATGMLWATASDGYGAYFSEFISHLGEPLAWQLAMLGLTMFVVVGGVRRGIEAANKVLMPLLAAFVVGLAIYVATLPGAGAGWRFLFVPDWSALADRRLYIAAMGQAFFSLGIGMAVFVTYASYMSESTRIPASATAIIFGDILFALVAGLAIFPAVFAFGMNPEAGPKLAFITLPQIFLEMPAGRILGAAFFLLLVVAALTSMASLLEVPVATLIHRTRLGRRGAVAVVGAVVFLLGVPSAMSYGLLAHVAVNGLAVIDFVDRTTSNYLLPLSGLAVCLYVGWVWKPKAAAQAADLGDGRWSGLWLWLLRMIAPAAILLIIFDSTGAL